jgi:hypothetical protein
MTSLPSFCAVDCAPFSHLVPAQTPKHLFSKKLNQLPGQLDVLLSFPKNPYVFSNFQLIAIVIPGGGAEEWVFL